MFAKEKTAKYERRLNRMEVKIKEGKTNLILRKSQLRMNADWIL